MIIVRIPQPDCKYFGDDDELSSYAIERAKRAGIDALVYYYISGSYEGRGEALLRNDGKWAYADLGHCSCYAPLASIPDTFEPLNDLLNRMSGELKQKTHPLFDAIAERGLDLT